MSNRSNFNTNWTYVVLPCHRVGEDDVPHRRVVIVNLGRRGDYEGPADQIGMAVDYVRECVISGGDEEFWGFSFGSRVEHAGGGHYYVARDPDSDADEYDEESEYEHCEALPTLATIVHSMSAALEAAYAMGDGNPYKIKP